MKTPIKQLPTFVNRTYRGGLLLQKFLKIENPSDSFQPEDWISSFIAAKNRIPIPNEGLTRALIKGEEKLLIDCVKPEDFGRGRRESGVLIKYLDAGERLGIQVHPTKDYARRLFNSEFGKTECWHILDTREIDGQPPCVYLGFKEHVTKALWRELFERQDIQGMLEAMHRFEVKKGDTILVTGGTPHAIGAGCFLLEIQEPSDYTMRVEKVTLAGEELTPMQIHYGVGEEAMLDCFYYEPKTREETKKEFFLSEKQRGDILVDYSDTTCFTLRKISAATPTILEEKDCVTALFLEDGGKIEADGFSDSAARGDKYFIPAGIKTTLSGAPALLCYPPQG